MFSNFEYIDEVTKGALKLRHSAEELKDEEMAIEICAEMMEKLKLREFISSKIMNLTMIANIFIEKNGKGVFALRGKATEV